MKKNYVHLIAIFICFISVNTSNSQWIPSNQVDGMGTYSFDTVGNVLYCGVYIGGVFRSTDNGLNWTNINNGILPGLVFAITHNETYLFVGTNHYGVYRSSNSGLEWEQVNSGFPNSQDIGIRSIIANGSTVFAGRGGSYNERGIYVTTNNGDTWVRTDTSMHSPYTYTFTYCGSYLFAGTSDGVFRTSDNGVNWQNVNSGMINYGSWLLAVNGTKIYSAGSHGIGTGGLYVSTNFGINWTLLLPNAKCVYTYDNYIFASINQNFFMSTDNGSNWVNRSQGLYESIVSLYGYNNYAFAGTFLVSYPYVSGYVLYRCPLSELISVKLYC